MADDFKAESLVTEASDVKGAAKIYYTLAVEKLRDVCVCVCVYDETVCVAAVSGLNMIISCYMDLI